MSKFIEKLKAFFEKVKTAFDKFAVTPAGEFVVKTLAMIYTLLMIGGICCIIAAAAILKMGWVPCIAVAFVCAGAVDEIIKAVKIILS